MPARTPLALMSQRDAHVVILETSPREDWSKIIAEQGGLSPSTVNVSNGIVRPQLDGALATGQGSIIS